jgi:DNA repair exonuclease SbcCD ATPase subunit
MYITKIEIQNIRTINKLSIDLNSSARSIILSGDNGSGKSTVLRCIAMGLTDEDSAASVLRDSPGEFVKKGELEGNIDIYLISESGQRFRIHTKIKSLPAFEKVYQKIYKYTNGKQTPIAQENFLGKKFLLLDMALG